jgi:hypothetical protein
VSEHKLSTEYYSLTGIYNQESEFFLLFLIFFHIYSDNTNCSNEAHKNTQTERNFVAVVAEECIHLCNLPSATIYFYATVVTQYYITSSLRMMLWTLHDRNGWRNKNIFKRRNFVLFATLPLLITSFSDSNFFHFSIFQCFFCLLNIYFILFYFLLTSETLAHWKISWIWFHFLRPLIRWASWCVFSFISTFEKSHFALHIIIYEKSFSLTKISTRGKIYFLFFCCCSSTLLHFKQIICCNSVTHSLKETKIVENHLTTNFVLFLTHSHWEK